MRKPSRTDHQADQLYELADLIHAIARRLTAPANLKPGPCTPVEINVMRYIGKNPGTSAKSAAAATLLASSNFSRVVKGLIAKGLLRREVDERDARGARLYPTELARANAKRMRDVWSRALSGMTADMGTVELANAALARIETALAAQSTTPDSGSQPGEALGARATPNTEQENAI